MTECEELNTVHTVLSTYCVHGRLGTQSSAVAVIFFFSGHGWKLLNSLGSNTRMPVHVRH